MKNTNDWINSITVRTIILFTTNFDKLNNLISRYLLLIRSVGKKGEYQDRIYRNYLGSRFVKNVSVRRFCYTMLYRTADSGLTGFNK